MNCNATGKLIFEDRIYGQYSSPTGFTFGVDCREAQEGQHE